MAKTFLQVFKTDVFSEFNEKKILIQIVELFRIDFSDKKSAYTKPDAPYYVDNGSSTQVVIQYESSPLDAADDKCPKCLGSSSGLFFTHLIPSDMGSSGCSDFGEICW